MSATQFNRILRLAELASKANAFTATEQNKTLAWSNLQRLRHALEELIGPPDGDSEIPISMLQQQFKDHQLLQTNDEQITRPFNQIGYRLMQCLAPYLLGDREVTFNVDADAVRCWILLLDMGVVNILYRKDFPLLQNIGDTVMARALSILSMEMQEQWTTNPYLCDICGLATASLAIQLSLCIDDVASIDNHNQEQQEMNEQNEKNEKNLDSISNFVKVKKMGNRLHLTLEKLGSLRNDTQSKTAESMDHIQVAYMSVLRPSKMPSVMNSFGGMMAFLPVLLPVLCGYLLYDHGWREALESWYVIVGLCLVLLFSIGTFLVPYVFGSNVLQKLKRAQKISRMLVDMSIHLRPSANDFTLSKARGTYIVSPGAREKDEAISNDALKKQKQLTSIAEEKDVDADVSIQHTTTKEEDTAALQNMMLQINGGKDQDIQETRELMTTVQELGKVTVDSLGLHPKNENDNDNDDDNSGNETNKNTDAADAVTIPFPFELLTKLEKLEKMMVESNADPIEIENISNKIRFAKELMASSTNTSL